MLITDLHQVHFGQVWSTSVQFNQRGPNQVYFVLFGPIRSTLIHLVHLNLDLFRSNSIHLDYFGQLDSVWSTLVLFSLLRSFLVYFSPIPTLVLFITIWSIRSTSVNLIYFGPLGSLSSNLVYFGLIRSIYSTLIYPVHFGLIN